MFVEGVMEGGEENGIELRVVRECFFGYILAT